MESNNRLVIDGCKSNVFSAFIARLRSNAELKFKSHKPANDTVLQERYAFSSDYEAISVVYETKSSTLIITAPQHIVSLLKSDYERACLTAEAAKINPVPQAKPAAPKVNHPPAKAPAPAKQPPQKPAQTANNTAQKANPAQNPAPQQQKSPQTTNIPTQKPMQAANNAGQKPPVPCHSERSEAKSKKPMGQTANKTTTQNPAQKPTQATNNPMQKPAPQQQKPAPPAPAPQPKPAPQQQKPVAAKSRKDKKQKAREAEEKKVRATLEKKLKKLLPTAFELLSEQSRLDIALGMTDIHNPSVTVSDYSMLLVPPYRGLESLIFDLQKAQGLDVRMIGQAFDKRDGKYGLKPIFKKRAPSIIYNEVLSALYAEYFEKRNFYAHSDIKGDLLSRVITQKETVKTIFDNLLALIEYNAKKLKEIGFTMAP